MLYVPSIGNFIERFYLWGFVLLFTQPLGLSLLGRSDVDKLFHLVMVLLVFYVMYAFQNIFDAVFYGAGKTNYMLFESVVTNTVYYGIAFAAFQMGLWTPTLTGIAVMFGCGNAFDAVVSWLAYKYYLKKHT